jgi:hypothetical protein
MNRASEKAYISKKEIQLYQREKAKLHLKKQGFTEDKIMKDEEEAKKSQIAQIVIDDAELSAEEVESDDLGDDITQSRGAFS